MDTTNYVWKSKVFDTPVPSNVVVLVDIVIKKPTKVVKK